MATLRRTLGVFGVILLLIVGGLGMVRPPDKPLYFLAFVSDKSGVSQAYRILSDGSQAKQLTHFPTDAHYAILEMEWSGDAQWLMLEYSNQLYIVSVLGQVIHQISLQTTYTYSRSVFLDWSPDGNSVLYYFAPNDGNTELHIFNVDKNQRKNISEKWQNKVARIATSGGGEIAGITARSGFIDAKTILHQIYDGTYYQLYKVSLDGRMLTQITFDKADHDLVAVSADIALYIQQESLYTLDLQTLTTKQILASTEYQIDRGIHESPDGQWVAFAAFHNDERELYRMRWDGSAMIALTQGEYPQVSISDAYATGSIRHFDWSDDSEWIVFGGVDGIYKVRWDGTHKQHLIDYPCGDQNNDGKEAQAIWSPDGYWVAYIGADCNYGYATNLHIISFDGQEHRQLTPSSENYYTALRWSPIIDLDWHAFTLAAFGCGAIVLGYLLRQLRVNRRAGEMYLAPTRIDNHRG